MQHTVTCNMNRQPTPMQHYWPIRSQVCLSTAAAAFAHWAAKSRSVQNYQTPFPLQRVGSGDETTFSEDVVANFQFSTIDLVGEPRCRGSYFDRFECLIRLPNYVSKSSVKRGSPLNWWRWISSENVPRPAWRLCTFSIRLSEVQVCHLI